MEEELAKYKMLRDIIMADGLVILQALIMIVVGLILAKIVAKYFKILFLRFGLKDNVAATASNSIYVLIIVILLAIGAQWVGLEAVIIRRILIGVSLAAVGLIIIFRPLIPTLPFKVGNTVKAAGILGKVEATTLINTRLKTFDGKTVFVPNSKILNDTVENYHFTPNRQIRIEVFIPYEADLLKAKKAFFELITAEPRVLKTPAPRVRVLNLTEMGVKVGTRAWVNNLDYWVTRCDLIEKVKFRLDHDGIPFAYPQRVVHMEGHMEGEFE